MVELESALKSQQKPLVAALKEIVRIPSVNNDGEDGSPFGKAIDRALRKSLEITADLGLRTTYGEGGYYGYAEIGQGAEMGRPLSPWW